LALVLTTTAAMLVMAVTPAAADGPLVSGYILRDGERIPSPAAYVQMDVIGGTVVPSGKDQPYGVFNDPQDLFLDPATSNLLIADTGNNRVVVLDAQGNFLREIGGEAAGLKGPEGVFVDPEGKIWVADRGNGRVAVFDSDGAFVQQLTKPESSYLEGMDFSPSKILVDKRSFVYVVIGSQSNLGIVVIDNAERFRGFFGRTRIRFSLSRTIARLFATEIQRRRMLRIQPAPLSNLHLDSSGFIYAISPILQKDQIQRLNSVGTNVYGEVGTRTGAGKLWEKLLGKEGITFGESEVRWGWNNQMRMSVPNLLHPQFLDVAVDDLGIVSIIDGRNSRIYQYDQAGNLLSIFGGAGASAGFFLKPTSIVAGKEGILYVLDAGRGDIQVFRPTDLTRLIHQASHEYFNGDYDEAAKLWQQISEHNTNFALAHSGLGKALMGQRYYREAMQEYYYAENKFGYSDAFREYRHIWMRANFQWLGLGVIGAIVVVGAGWYRTLSRVRLFLAWLNERKARLGLWAVPLMLSLSILSWMVSLSVLSYHFTTRRPDEIRLLFESGKFLIPWFTWCVSAYGVGEIFYGEGTFRKILINSAWALWPVIVLLVPVNLLTNIISLNEKSLYSLLWYCVWGLLFWQFLMMIKETHQFELDQAFSIMLLTLVGMALIWILVGLVYALTAEIFRFIGQLVLEVYVRLY
jgi:hypothetical protein